MMETHDERKLTFVLVFVKLKIISCERSIEGQHMINCRSPYFVKMIIIPHI